MHLTSSLVGNTLRLAVAAIVLVGCGAGGNHDSGPAAASSAAADRTPPSAPSGLRAVAGSASSVDLAWTASRDNVSVSRYEIFRDQMETPVGVSMGSAYSDSTVMPGGSYSYKVRAVDTAGNGAAMSEMVIVSTPSPVSASPSDLSVPTGDLPNWKLKYTDDFTGDTLGGGWGAYETKYNATDGTPSMPDDAWQPCHVVVADGKLKLETYFVLAVRKWTSGGALNFIRGNTTYGKYDVCLRIDKANGVKLVLLLWPQSAEWPLDGEIDFA